MSKFYETVFTIRVISDRPLAADLDLSQVNHEITEGECSGDIKRTDREISSREAALLLIDQGSDPSFLNLGPQGELLDA